MEIKMSGIGKSFGTNKVLDDVNFHLKSGEIHALMGENGAGKSTLMNILTGIHKADYGKILVDGKEVVFSCNKDAEKAGIAFVHQELNIWPNMTLLENLFLSDLQKNKFGVVDFKKMRKLAEEKCADIGVNIPLDKIAEECSVGQQQLTEIVRSLMVDAKVIIMDEPTAALTERETDCLFSVMSKLKSRGVSIIYISHRMEEVFVNCDTITVMRDGKNINTYATKETRMEQLVSDMVGRVMS
ncbi:MAG: ATP-binding cassette domain-containing protein, partial [Dialister micraerophilus]|nr:ATP-binding cassette domain-containing protein [Dialister micraerophilus]